MSAAAGQLEETRRGQLRLSIAADVPRRPHPTGQQATCTRCEAAGRATRGVSRSGPDSPPLCLPCWRSDQDRQARAAVRATVAQGWTEVGAAAADEECPVCGPDGPPDPSCWWCGDRTWLAWMRWTHEQDQADAAAADQARVDAEFARLAELAAAGATVDDLTRWVERLHGTLTRYHARSGGRAVELLADYLATAAAARTTTVGRPSTVPALTFAVLAVDADWRSGRRAMPGQDETTAYTGASLRAVTDAWRSFGALGVVKRKRIGGRNSLERRRATGRANDRAEFDLRPLHRSPIGPAVRAAYIPQALTLLGQLLRRAQQLLDAALAELDRCRAAGPPGWSEQARRAQARQSTRRILAELVPPDTADRARNYCHPHPVTRGEHVSSGTNRGLLFTRPTMIHRRTNPAPAFGRREDGASRSPTRGAGQAGRACAGFAPGTPLPPPLHGPCGPHGPEPRTRPVRHRKRPSWTIWAYDLARNLIPAVPWLAQARLPELAATLGARLGPDWTAPALLAWLTRARLRPLLDAPDRPVAYLAAVLDDALTGDLAPPHRARRHDEHRRRLVVAERDARRDRQAAARAATEDSTAGRAQARAVLAQVAASRRAASEPWPAVAQPGAGLPRQLRPGK